LAKSKAVGISSEIPVSAAEIKLDLKLSSRIEKCDLGLAGLHHIFPSVHPLEN